MILGRVVGTVVANQKDDRLAGDTLLIVRQLDLKAQPSGAYVVAADAVGAGAGEVVLVATGSSARQTGQTDGKPVDAVVMAIVDLVEVEGAVTYRKAESPAGVAG